VIAAALDGPDRRVRRAGSPHQPGHCYPWAGWATLGSQAWDTWTNNNHTDC